MSKTPTGPGRGSADEEQRGSGWNLGFGEAGVRDQRARDFGSGVEGKTSGHEMPFMDTKKSSHESTTFNPTRCHDKQPAAVLGHAPVLHKPLSLLGCHAL